MSEKPGHMESSDGTGFSPLSNKRVLVLMAAITVSGALISHFAVSADFSGGVLVGGAISLLSYFWLSKSLRSMLQRAVRGESTQFQAFKFFLRYVLIGAVLVFVYRSSAFPMIAVLLGLASFAGAIVVEGLVRLVRGIISQKEDR